MIDPDVWAVAVKTAKEGDVSCIRGVTDHIIMHDFESMETLMLIACENGHTHFVEWLLNSAAAEVLMTPRGYDCNFYAKSFAAETGNMSMLKLLMAYTPNPPNELKMRIFSPGTILMGIAVHHGRLNVVQYLVDKLPYVVNSEWNDFHPLMRVSRTGHLDIFNWLARYYIDHKKHVQWYDLLLKASEFCGWSVIKSLLVNFNDLPKEVFNVYCVSLEANYNAITANSSIRSDSIMHLVINQNPNDGLIPLHKAVKAGDTRLVSKLVTDENINEQDNEGETALHLAFRRENFDETLGYLVAILNSNFASYSVFNNYKQTP